MPVLIWTTHKLDNGWVLLCVDVTISQPGAPEALLGYRRAVHPFQFDDSDDPVMDFGFVIAEMTYRVTRGLEGLASEPAPVASRACAFGDDPIMKAFQAGRDSMRSKAVFVDGPRQMADIVMRNRRLQGH